MQRGPLSLLPWVVKAGLYYTVCGCDTGLHGKLLCCAAVRPDGVTESHPAPCDPCCFTSLRLVSARAMCASGSQNTLDMS